MENSRLRKQLFIHHEDVLIKTFHLKNEIYFLGAMQECNECEGYPYLSIHYPTISKKHCKLESNAGKLWITDFYSRNGIFKDDGKTRLNPGERIEWKKEEILLIGPFTFSWNESHQPLFEPTAIYAEAFNPFSNTLKSIDTSSEGKKVLDSVYSEIHGDGPLEGLLQDPSCKDIIINGASSIFVDRGDGLKKIDVHFISELSYESWVLRTAHDAGRRLDLQNPICHATLKNGARFHAVLPPIANQKTSVAIRRLKSAPLDEKAALEAKWLDEKSLVILRRGIQERKNILIAGGTGSGKTSLLNFLCQYMPSHERLITIEDTIELTPRLENCVQLQSREANADGIGKITVRELLASALRMRPDRIIVGECRGSEVIDMLQAFNTGHPGSLSTIHANSALEALKRLELLALLGAQNLSVEGIREWIHTSIDLIVYVTRFSNGIRAVSEIYQKTGLTFEKQYERNSH